MNGITKVFQSETISLEWIPTGLEYSLNRCQIFAQQFAERGPYYTGRFVFYYKTKEKTLLSFFTALVQHDTRDCCEQ